MHRAASFVLMIPLLLCACGAEREEAALTSFREEIAGRSVALSADITRQWEDKVFTCSVDAAWENGVTRAVLTAPDTVAGVAFHTGEEDALEYDGAILFLGDGVEALSPAMAVPRTMKALTDGRVLYTGRDRERWFAVFAQEEGERLTVYFSRETGQPEYAELEAEGRIALALRVTAWRLGEQV